LERARHADRPILLSIGYAACHWCHVMAHESFEDQEVARLMNDMFVNIKVDREERPDLDAIYMSAVQAMTGHGGWPMTVFLTPEGVPFYGGTYFPPDDRHGMPSFRRVLTSVAGAYRDRRGEIEATAQRMRALYVDAGAHATSGATPTPALLAAAARGIAQRYDARHGGFQGAPKFPQTMVLDFVLRAWRRGILPEGLDIALHSFRAMSQGGIHDQVGGGFHRYSVDDGWLVPHFEKMLYDNALLIRLGVHLYQATGDADVRQVTRDAIIWVAREMTSPEGGFYASLDADSEGEEGRFYVWTMDELDRVLGDEAAIVGSYWGASRAGNFEGRNILHVAANVAADAGLADTVRRARGVLAAARATRVRPTRDEKVIASWNGLMLRAIAEAARAFADDEVRGMALRNGEFLFRELVRDDRVMRTLPGVRNGAIRPGYLEDHAAVALGALALYELTFDAIWVTRAHALADAITKWFWQETDKGGAFYDTARDHEELIARPREVTDNATPTGTSLAVELLLRLGDLLDDDRMRARADSVLASLTEPMERYPMAFGQLLSDADLAVHGPVEVALVSHARASGLVDLERAVATCYVPALVLAGRSEDGSRAAPDIAVLRGREPRGDAATAYVCRRYTCDEPTTSPVRLRTQLDAASVARPA
jgi:hypothetical protein